jgi:hypothetical protein
MSRNRFVLSASNPAARSGRQKQNRDCTQNSNPSCRSLPQLPMEVEAIWKEVSRIERRPVHRRGEHRSDIISSVPMAVRSLQIDE